MRTVGEELKAAAAVLAILDGRRIAENNPGLGSAIEKALLDRCLADLESDWSPVEPEPQEEELIFCRTRKRTKTN